MVAGRCDKSVAAGVQADKDSIIRSGVTSAPSKVIRSAALVWSGLACIWVEVATVVNMRTVTGDGQVVLGISRRS